MEQYYYTDGKERYGPFTQDQLRERNIGPETLIWKEGMPDWVAAKKVTELQSLFHAAESIQVSAPIQFIPQSIELPPKNWLVESILVTFLCCMPLGIVGIVNASKVDVFWRIGQKEAALQCSREAGKWVKISFIIGIFGIGIYFLMMMMGVFGTMMFGAN